MSRYDGNDSFMYEITIRNYNSLDAAMKGMEYSLETSKGVFHMSKLVKDCKILKVAHGGGGPTKYVLERKQ